MDKKVQNEEQKDKEKRKLVKQSRIENNWVFRYKNSE